MQRLLNFDIAKALCIILVAIGHFIPDYAPTWYLKFWHWIYSFHMPLFMFASGFIYIAFKKEESYSSFIQKKLKRLMIPYFVVSTIIISIKLLSQNAAYVENPVSTLSFLNMLYKAEAGYFLWFVWALFTYFLITPFFKTKLSRYMLFFIAILLHYIPFETTTILALHESKRMFVWFMLGIFCYDVDIQSIFNRLGKKGNRVLHIAILVSFVISSYLNINKTIIALFMPWLGIASVMIISTWVAKFSNSTPIRPLITLSAASYIVYLLHTTFEGFFKAVFHKLPIVSNNINIQFCIEAMVIVACGIIIPTLLYCFVLNRFKWTCFLFGLPFKKK